MRKRIMPISINDIKPAREYVLASTKHMNRGILQFWGHLTRDDEERSLGGYYADINSCERFTEEETKLYRKGEFPTLTAGSEDLETTEHYWIKISELDKADDLKRKTVYCFI